MTIAEIDRWAAPTLENLRHQLDDILAGGRAESGGGWPEVSHDHRHKLAEFFDQVILAVVEPDSDCDMVLSVAVTDRSKHHFPAAWVCVPVDPFAPDVDVREWVRNIAALNSIASHQGDVLAAVLYDRENGSTKRTGKVSR